MAPPSPPPHHTSSPSHHKEHLQPRPSAQPSPSPSSPAPHPPNLSQSASPDSDPDSPSPSPSPPLNPQSQLPLPLSASLTLAALPPDTTTALQLLSSTTSLDPSIPEKVTIRFQPVGSAPLLRQRVVKVGREKRFDSVVSFLGRKLGMGAASAAAKEGKEGGQAGDKGHGHGHGQQVFCYVNGVFAPGLDEGVGGLWKCFKTEEQLTVAYSVTPAFG